MADIRQFMAKISLTSHSKPKKSSVMEKFNNDKVTLRHMSRDGLESLMQKQQHKIISRSALNEELLQNIKKAQLATQKFQERISSLPDLRLARSKTSSSSVANSRTFLRSMSPDLDKPALHGFHYRSDGNFRARRRNSIEEKAEMFEKLSRRDLTSLKQTLLKATMIHCRDTYGDYMFTPMLNEVLKRESIASKPTSELPDNVDIFRFITKDQRHGDETNSKMDDDAVFKHENFRDKPLIGRQFFIQENDQFINCMMQHIHQLERHSNIQRSFTNPGVHETDLDFEIPLKGGRVLSKSDQVFDTERHLSARHSSMAAGATQQSKSLNNMLYGVSSRILASRKLLLDEYLNEEMKKMSKTDIEIDEYIRDIEKVMEEKEIKRTRRGRIPFDFWKTESDNIVSFQDVHDISQPEIGLLPDTA